MIMTYLVVQVKVGHGARRNRKQERNKNKTERKTTEQLELPIMHIIT